MSRVCVFGDSITWGSWDPLNGGWVGRLRQAGCEHVNPLDGDYVSVYNCGIGGDRVRDVLARFDVEAAARMPVAIVIAIGINDVPRDGGPGTAPEEFRSQFVELIRKARRFTRDIVVVTPTNVDESRSEHDYRNADIELLAREIRNVANERHLPLVETYGVLTNEDLEPDGLHPGSEGHEKLFQLIAPTVFALPTLQW